MLESTRKFLESGAGKAAAGLLVVVGLAFVLFTLWGLMSSEGERASANRMFIDIETNQPFEHELTMGEKLPVRTPSGKDSGYPAEACYWTKDGKPKDKPTWVFVSNVWKGTKEPSFCPDCGRLVVGHNPPPGDGRTAPPTKDDYAKNPRRGTAERR